MFSLSSLGSRLRPLLDGISHLLFSPSCLVCATPLGSDNPTFCLACKTHLTSDCRNTCLRCAATVGPHTFTDFGCLHCRRVIAPVARTLRLGVYRKPDPSTALPTLECVEEKFANIIVLMKWPTSEGLIERVTDLWFARDEARFRACLVDAVVPIPRHWRRWLVRGCNPPATVARVLAGHLKVPYRPEWLRRIRHTESQVGKTRVARADNVRGAFQASKTPHLQGAHVLLVDDVMTTCSTVVEAAKTLRKAGVARITVAVLGRSESRSNALLTANRSGVP